MGLAPRVTFLKAVFRDNVSIADSMPIYWNWHHLIDRVQVLIRPHYDRILYHFQNKARYWSETPIFHTPLHLACMIRYLYRRLAIWHEDDVCRL